MISKHCRIIYVGKDSQFSPIFRTVSTERSNEMAQGLETSKVCPETTEPFWPTFCEILEWYVKIKGGTLNCQLFIVWCIRIYSFENLV